jgi:hypothetical protein
MQKPVTHLQEVFFNQPLERVMQLIYALVEQQVAPTAQYFSLIIQAQAIPPIS